MKGYATVYGQCSQEVRDKLKTSKDWETIQQEQSLHNLILQVENICVGFDDHKQDMYNLVQALKTLFLYTQSEKESIKEYGQRACGTRLRHSGAHQEFTGGSRTRSSSP